MAIVWEFTIISEKAISLEIFNRISKEYENVVKVMAIFSIDDWGWTNQQKLENISEIKEKLNNGKIIIVEMQSKPWKSLGMYVEKEEAYIYTFWINTEGVPELDVDQITNVNKKYYNQVFHILDRLIKEYNFPLDYIAIGMESEIQYCADINKMISNSNNVIAWLTKNNNNVVLPENLERYKVTEELDAIVARL